MDDWTPKQTLDAALRDLAHVAATTRKRLQAIEDAADELQSSVKKLGSDIASIEDALAGLDSLDLVASDATYPRSLDLAITYLTTHRSVRFHSSNPNTDRIGTATFLRLSEGIMWFREAGIDSHLPVNCGMVGRETGLSFGRNGFKFTKFDVTCTVTYLEGPHATPFP